MTSTLGLINLPERLPELREHRCAAVRYEGNDKGRRQTKGAWVRPGKHLMPELGVQPSPSTWKLFEPPT